jgi:hypothetical protein
LEERHKLGAYKLFVDQDAEIPTCLKEHLDTVILRKKADFSVGARRIVQRRRTILEQNEPGAIRLVEPFMLPSGEAEDECGLPLISKKYDILFAKPFLPHPPPLVRQSQT